MSSLVPCQNSLKRKISLTPSSGSTDQQGSPLSSISPGSYTHCLYISDEFETTKKEVFRTFPNQKPHFKPLEKYSPSIRDAMKVALELDFVHLATTFTQAVDPVEFFKGIGDYSSQLSTLEEMGYDVKKIWEKFDELRSIAADEIVNRENKEELKSKMKDLEVKAHFTENRLSELRKEMILLEANAKTQETETQNLKSKVRRCTLKEQENLVNFRTAATKPW